MASSGDVRAVLEPVVVEQPAVKASDGGEISLPAATTGESKPMTMQAERQHGDNTAPDADHREAVPTAEASESEKLHKQQKPVAATEEAGAAAAAAGDQAESTRERLKRHRREMAGRVWVPELWGQEKLLKDWVDCAAFDRPLVPTGLLTARRALIAECCARRRPDRTSPASSAGSSPLRVHNGCS